MFVFMFVSIRVWAGMIDDVYVLILFYKWSNHPSSTLAVHNLDLV